MHEFVPHVPSRGTVPSKGSSRYAIEEVLGAGSMGIVYRAKDRVLGRTVAIKTIRKELISKDSEYRAACARFLQEARIFGSLSHPNIVALYDAGETTDGLPFLTMEYIPDASLGALARRLTLDQAMWLLAQGLRVLPAGTGYAVWTGIGAVGTAILGIVLLGESRNGLRLLCIGLIVVGIIGLRVAE